MSTAVHALYEVGKVVALFISNMALAALGTFIIVCCVNTYERVSRIEKILVELTQGIEEGEIA